MLIQSLCWIAGDDRKSCGTTGSAKGLPTLSSLPPMKTGLLLLPLEVMTVAYETTGWTSSVGVGAQRLLIAGLRLGSIVRGISGGSSGVRMRWSIGVTGIESDVEWRRMNRFLWEVDAEADAGDCVDTE